MQQGEYHSLDATAGLRMYWRRRSQQGVVFLDIRREMKPDIVASNECLPFRTSCFKRVFYDPPHIICEDGSIAQTDFGWRYGFWRHKSDLVRNIYRVNKEFARVLVPRGELFLFYTDYHENPSIESVLALLGNFDVIDWFRRPSRAMTGNLRHEIKLAKRD